MIKEILAEEYNRFVEAVDVENLRMIESSCKFDERYAGSSLTVNIKESYKYSTSDSGFIVETRWAMKANSEENKDPAVSVVAKYSAIFSLEGDLEVTKELIDAFYDRSIAMLGWTYFREHVNSCVVKMGLPSLTLPLRKR